MRSSLCRYNLGSTEIPLSRLLFSQYSIRRANEVQGDKN